MTDTFLLKAHLTQFTPLLHFQGRTKGACLRPSEVKPKLDKFLYSFLKSKGSIPDGWLMKRADDKEEKADKNYPPAFRYKMSIIGKSVEMKEIHPLYFAGNMKGGSKKIPVSFKDGLDLRIFFPQNCKWSGELEMHDATLREPTLKAVLEKILPAFFSLHCFGTRSGKGFGAFFVDHIDDQDIENYSDNAIDYYMPSYCQKIYRLESARAKSFEYYKESCLDDIYVYFLLGILCFL